MAPHIVAMVPYVVAGLLTLLAIVWDWQVRRIPNFLTLPAFVAGIVFQAAFFGWAGLEQAGLGFLIGFGTLFLLWMIGGGGGGDVKLMGALGVWLGSRLILQVLLVSVVLVWLAAVSALIMKLSTKPKPDVPPGTKPARHVVAFAIPVGLATWLILGAHLLKTPAETGNAQNLPTQRSFNNP